MLLTQTNFADANRQDDSHLNQRPLSVIIRQSLLLLSIFAAISSYAVMSLLMSATSLAMHQHGLGFNDSAQVIQWHVLGCFCSLFSRQTYRAIRGN